MKRKSYNLLICMTTIIFLIEILLYPKIVLETFLSSSKIWLNNIVPFLFPFLIIMDILSNYSLFTYISLLFGNIFKKLFKLPKEASYAFFISIFSGFPGNSIFIKDLLDRNILTNYQATKLLTFTHFSNPLFIIGTIGFTLLNNTNIGYLILLVHYGTNIIIGLLFRNIYYDTNYTYKKKEKTILPFVTVLKESILKNTNTLLIVFGIILFFSLIVNIINITLSLPPLPKALLNGFLEVTNGLNLVNSLNIPLNIKVSIMTLLLSFGGISIHLQELSILSNYKINYYIYLLARIIHASLSSLIIYLILTYY